LRELEEAGRKAGLEALLEGDAFGGNLLGALLESFRLITATSASPVLLISSSLSK
jgi:hypothetical protein